MRTTRCPRCDLPFDSDEVQAGACPVCKAPLGVVSAAPDVLPDKQPIGPASGRAFLNRSNSFQMAAAVMVPALLAGMVYWLLREPPSATSPANQTPRPVEVLPAPSSNERVTEPVSAPVSNSPIVAVVAPQPVGLPGRPAEKEDPPSIPSAEPVVFTNLAPLTNETKGIVSNPAQNPPPTNVVPASRSPANHVVAVVPPPAEKPKPLPSSRPPQPKPPAKDNTGTTRLDDPDGTYSLPHYSRKEVRLTGRLKMLKTLGIVDGAVLDTTGLELKEASIGWIGNGGVVRMTAPGANLHFVGVQNRSSLTVQAPDGKVVVDGPVGGEATLNILAKEVQFLKNIYGPAQITVTLSKGGRLKVQEMFRGELRYRKADPSDPEPVVELGKIEKRYTVVKRVE
jgi:hypothetical protein